MRLKAWLAVIILAACFALVLWQAKNAAALNAGRLINPPITSPATPVPGPSQPPITFPAATPTPTIRPTVRPTATPTPKPTPTVRPTTAPTPSSKPTSSPIASPAPTPIPQYQLRGHVNYHYQFSSRFFGQFSFEVPALGAHVVIINNLTALGSQIETDIFGNFKTKLPNASYSVSVYDRTGTKFTPEVEIFQLDKNKTNLNFTGWRRFNL